MDLKIEIRQLDVLHEAPIRFDHAIKEIGHTARTDFVLFTIYPWVASDRTPDDHRREKTIQPMKQSMKSQGLPDTDSIEALSNFWDTHDLTDLEDQVEDVRTPFFVRGEESADALSLNPKEIQALKRMAKSVGVWKQSWCGNGFVKN